MKLVVIESPYAGDVEANLAYGRRAMKDCIEQRKTLALLRAAALRQRPDQ